MCTRLHSHSSSSVFTVYTVIRHLPVAICVCACGYRIFFPDWSCVKHNSHSRASARVFVPVALLQTHIAATCKIATAFRAFLSILPILPILHFCPFQSFICSLRCLLQLALSPDLPSLFLPGHFIFSILSVFSSLSPATVSFFKSVLSFFLSSFCIRLGPLSHSILY